MSTPQLRPLGIGEILDVGMKIAWRNAGTLIRAVVFVVLPVQILSAVIFLSSLPDGVDYDQAFFGTPSAEPGVALTDSELAAFSAGQAVTLLLGVVGSVLATGACFRAIATAYLGEQTGWRESLSFALRRLHSILWVTILAAVLAVLGVLACFVGAIYLWVIFAVAVPVLMTEGVRGTKALGRSRRLVSGFWWRVFAVTLLGLILVLIISGVLAGIAAGISSVGADSSPLVIGVQMVVVDTLAGVLTTPLLAAFTTILYFDLRVRKEAFDLQLMADRLGVEPPAGYVPPSQQQQQQGAAPPYWPPPPGWEPPAPPPPVSDSPAWRPGAPLDPAQEEEPPYWPPPPGWKPSDRE